MLSLYHANRHPLTHADSDTCQLSGMTFTLCLGSWGNMMHSCVTTFNFPKPFRMQLFELPP